MRRQLRPTTLLIAVLGVAVAGLGTVVAVDHSTTAPQAQTASLSASNTAASLLASGLASGEFGAAGQFKNEAAHVFDFFTTDTKLTWRQIGTELLGGKTLGQIAGPDAAKVERDALAEVRAGLSLGAAKGAITAAQETRLVNDAQDAISVLMAAKLSALLPSGR